MTDLNIEEEKCVICGLVAFLRRRLHQGVRLGRVFLEY